MASQWTDFNGYAACGWFGNKPPPEVAPIFHGRQALAEASEIVGTARKEIETARREAADLIGRVVIDVFTTAALQQLVLAIDKFDRESALNVLAALKKSEILR